VPTGTQLRSWILVEPLIAALLWGGVFAAAKLGMHEIPVPAFITVRLLIAAGLLIAIAGGLSWLLGARPAWRALLVAGLAQTSFQVFLLQGIFQTTAALSAILLATAPLLTGAWLGVTGRERLVPRQWLGLAVGLAGVVLLVGADGLSGEGTVVGNLIAFGAAVTWAWYGIAIGPAARVVGPIRAAAGTVALAAVVLLPYGLADALAFDWSRVSFAGWGGLLYGAVLGLCLATALWVRSVQRYGTQATMNYSYLEPVAAVVIAAAVLGEVLRPVQGIGAVLALVGVYLASTPPAVR
jgi:drug/metabolite transporter (DMT)-like permease